MCDETAAIIFFLRGPVAQLVEQRIENPRVGGSIPPQATTQNQAKSPTDRLGFLFCGALFATTRRYDRSIAI